MQASARGGEPAALARSILGRGGAEALGEELELLIGPLLRLFHGQEAGNQLVPIALNLLLLLQDVVVDGRALLGQGVLLGDQGAVGADHAVKQAREPIVQPRGARGEHRLHAGGITGQRLVQVGVGGEGQGVVVAVALDAKRVEALGGPGREGERVADDAAQFAGQRVSLALAREGPGRDVSLRVRCAGRVGVDEGLDLVVVRDEILDRVARLGGVVADLYST